MADKVRKLKDLAARQLNKGRHEKALEALLQVVRLEPRDLPSRQRCGDLYRKLGQTSNAVRQYQAVAGAYAADGFLLKAIAVCKVILQIDPKHTETQQTLAELYASKRGSSMTAEMPAAMSVAVGKLIAPSQAASTPAAAAEIPGSVAALTGMAPGDTVLELEDPDAPSGLELDLEARGLTPLPGTDLSLVLIEAQHDDVDRNLFADDDDDDAELFELDMDMDIDVDEDVDDGSSHEINPSQLPPIPLFSELDEKAFVELLQRLDWQHLSDAAAVVTQGEVGQSFYVIVSGTVRVERRNEAGETQILARLGEGSFFGEMALLGDGLRSASVVAEGEVDLFELSRPMLDALSANYPSVEQVMLRFSKQRLLANLLNTSPLFAPFDRAARKVLIEKFKSRPVAEKTDIVVAGQRGDGLYVLLSGRAQVVASPKQSAVVLADLGPGSIFGEISLLKNEPVGATVRSLTPCTILRLPAKIFRELVMSQPEILDLVSRLADSRLEDNANQGLVSPAQPATRDDMVRV